MEPSPVKKKSKKDTSVDTSFLPDKDRAATLATEERRLKREWTDSQALIKSEKLAVTFSYWDGSGHRREIVVTKGSTVGEFLDAASGDLQKEFREVGGADTLMYDVVHPNTPNRSGALLSVLYLQAHIHSRRLHRCIGPTAKGARRHASEGAVVTLR